MSFDLECDLAADAASAVSRHPHLYPNQRALIAALVFPVTSASGPWRTSLI
jgi:hypothetical protein